MALLAIELSTATGSVALFRDQICLGDRSWTESANGHRLFFDNLRAIFAQTGISARELTSIAVDTGPGVFSGLRIALSSAEALALPNKLPVLGITTAEILAWAHHRATQETHVWIVGDARRDQLWSCRVTMRNGHPELASQYTLTSPSEFAENVLANPASVLTPHWARIGNTLLQLGLPAPRLRQEAAIPTAKALGELATTGAPGAPGAPSHRTRPALIYMHPAVALRAAAGSPAAP